MSGRTEEKKRMRSRGDTNRRTNAEEAQKGDAGMKRRGKNRLFSFKSCGSGYESGRMKKK